MVEHGAQCFFNLTSDQMDHNMSRHVIDSFWGVKAHSLIKAIKKMFHSDNLRKFMPDLNPEFSPSFKLFDPNKTLDWKPFSNKPIRPLPPIGEDFPPVRNNLIAITGHLRHGKTTIAEHLVDKYYFIEYSFGVPLKEGCRHIFNLSWDQVYTEEKDEVDPRLNVTPRYILQKVGTDMIRDHLIDFLPQLKLDSSLWIANFERWFGTIFGIFDESDQYEARVVVSDVRFLDEAEILAKYGFIQWYVQRSPNTFTEEELKLYGNYTNHTSELEISKITSDVGIFNTKTVADLLNEVDHILSE